ncbi:MAG: hypothetical protein R3B07_34240 [Polyangiaceae bacterium]
MINEEDVITKKDTPLIVYEEISSPELVVSLQYALERQDGRPARLDHQSLTFRARTFATSQLTRQGLHVFQERQRTPLEHVDPFQRFR